MAVRNPSNFNTWVDQSQLLAAKRILTTGPSQITDDQVYVLDQDELQVSDQSACQRFTGTSFVEHSVFTLQGKDTCGAAGKTIDYYVAAFCWTDGAATGEVRITSSGGGTRTLSLAAADSTPAWRSLGASVNALIGNGSASRTLTLDARRVASGTAIYVGGLAIFAEES